MKAVSALRSACVVSLLSLGPPALLAAADPPPTRVVEVAVKPGAISPPIKRVNHLNSFV